MNQRLKIEKLRLLTSLAEFERDLLIERTNAGIKRAKAERKVFGSPTALSAIDRADVQNYWHRGHQCQDLHAITKAVVRRLLE
jgi:DNA invertase Pin-like site-specific DNA recombinase